MWKRGTGARREKVVCVFGASERNVRNLMQSWPHGRLATSYRHRDASDGPAAMVDGVDHFVDELLPLESLGRGPEDGLGVLVLDERL